MEFQLVPWSPSLERNLGKHVSGIARTDGGRQTRFRLNELAALLFDERNGDLNEITDDLVDRLEVELAVADPPPRGAGRVGRLGVAVGVGPGPALREGPAGEPQAGGAGRLVRAVHDG